MLGAILLADPVPRRDELLTNWGRMYYLPERDVNHYITGVAVALGLSLLLAWVWGAIFASGGTRRSRRFFVGAAALKWGVAVGTILLFLSRWASARTGVISGRPVSRSDLVAFAAIGLSTLAAAAPWELLRRPGPKSLTHEDPDGRSRSPDGPVSDTGWQLRSRRYSMLDFVAPAVIFVVTYVPAWRPLAGRFFLTDGFLHWDYYAMGPALAFRSGDALGTDYYAMYGLGWPAVFGLLSPWVPLSYGRMIQISSLYACLYFFGVYLLFRLLLRRPWLAAAGTGLAMLHLFLGMGTAVTWVLPSLTVLRWAFDVWCFIALVQHRNTGRRIWAVAAGVLVGLAVVFSTDTGLYLGAAVVFYWLCVAWGGRNPTFRPMDVVWALAGAAATLAAGLAVAARGTIFDGAFWNGWLEPLRDYRGGYFQVPLATFPDDFTVACFAVLVFTYLAIAGGCLTKVLYRRAGRLDLFSGMFAVYGLMNLIHFVGRSAAPTFFRLGLPMVFIMVLAGGHAYSRAEAAIAERWGRRGRFAVPACVFGGLAMATLLALFAAPAALLLNPVQAYPNLVSRALRGPQEEGLCMLAAPQDICGLPPEFKATATQVQAIAGRLETLGSQGKSVAIIDESGSIFYLASGQSPFGRYPRIFFNMYSQRNLRRVAGSLTTKRPDYVLTRMPLESADPGFGTWAYFGLGPRADTPHPDSWATLLDLVHSNYRLDERLEPFELWVLRAS